MPGDELRPRQAVRRFDVFAEYNKLKALQEGRPLDEAKGHGLWLAKVVASRRFGPSLGREPPGRDGGGERKERETEEHERFRTLSGEPQTDELFDREIVNRMGAEFYERVFAPTIAEHFERGDRYEFIRDSVRKDWKPARW